MRKLSVSTASFHYCITCVVLLGGLEVVSKDRKWGKIQTRMGLPNGRSLGTLLKSHYERILYPFDVFQQSPKALGDVVSVVYYTFVSEYMYYLLIM